MSPKVSLAKVNLANVNNAQRLRAKQFGGSLIMAIFMIVFFSLLAAAMVPITNSNSNQLSYHTLGQRAYLAAETGNQWALQQLLPMAATPLNCQYMLARTIPNISATTGLKGCKIVNLQCQELYAAEQVVVALTATGHCQIGELSSQRTLQVLAKINDGEGSELMPVLNVSAENNGLNDVRLAEAKNTAIAAKATSATIISILEIDG